LDFACTAHAFFPGRLSNHCQGLCGAISKICRKFDPVPLSDPSRNRIRPETRLQIKGRKKSARPPSCVKFCTLTPKICWYCHLPLHRATTTAVQMTASDPEIIDTPYKIPRLWVNVKLSLYLNRHQAIMTHQGGGGLAVQFHVLSNSEVFSSRTGHLTPDA
jgi:hypothetical protein